MAMRSIKKDKDGSPSILGEDVVKVVVIGEPKVGKTSFIRAFYHHHEKCQRYTYNGVAVYICEFSVNGTCKRAAIFEIPGDAGFSQEQSPPHYEDAKVIVLMYAIDDPLSLELLTDKWLPKPSEMVSPDGIPVVLVGNKKDLRDDQYVIERLDLIDEIPVTYEQGRDLLIHERIKYFAEISTDNLKEVNAAFDLIFNFALTRTEGN